MARRLGVSRDDVVAAAVRVCDREGLDRLTVAAVAAEVGCQPPSVYHHVDGLDGLVRAVTFVAAEQLVGALEVARQQAAPGDALAEMAAVAHGWGVRHPARFDALQRPVDASREPELAAARDQVLLPVQDALVALAVPTHRRATLLTALVAAVRGGIAIDLDASAGPDATPADATPADATPADATPTNATPTDARTAGRELLVRLLLDHITALASEHGDGRTATSADDPTRASP